MTKLISIIVPVYNEEELINSTINRLQSEVNDWSYNHEIIYVNDGSNDSTLAILKKYYSHLRDTSDWIFN